MQVRYLITFFYWNACAPADKNSPSVWQHCINYTGIVCRVIIIAVFCCYCLVTICVYCIYARFNNILILYIHTFVYLDIVRVRKVAGFFKLWCEETRKDWSYRLFAWTYIDTRRSATSLKLHYYCRDRTAVPIVASHTSRLPPLASHYKFSFFLNIKFYYTWDIITQAQTSSELIAVRVIKHKSACHSRFVCAAKLESSLKRRAFAFNRLLILRAYLETFPVYLHLLRIL